MADNRVDKAGLIYFYNKIKNKFQNKLVAGSNVSISGNTISATDTTYSNATSSAAGLMSAADKSKLDGVSGNWLDGSATGSVRTIGSYSEDSNYTMGDYAVTEGYDTYASGNYSHAEGNNNWAYEDCSHVEGYYNVANGLYSHVEGSESEAKGSCAHAEGYNTSSDGENSHAEGYNTWASGNNSHVEGEGTQAIGENSHAAGKYSRAFGNAQYVIGKNNKVDETAFELNEYGIDEDQKYYVKNNDGDFELEPYPSESLASTYYVHTGDNAELAFIIGNGDSYYNRSNALTVDWNGNVNIPSGASYQVDGVPISGGGGGDIFPVVRDSTSYQDIATALTNNKTIVAIEGVANSKAVIPYEVDWNGSTVVLKSIPQVNLAHRTIDFPQWTIDSSGWSDTTQVLDLNYPNAETQEY